MVEEIIPIVTISNYVISQAEYGYELENSGDEDQNMW